MTSESQSEARSSLTTLPAGKELIPGVQRVLYPGPTSFHEERLRQDAHRLQ